jgi:hypothetical protein
MKNIVLTPVPKNDICLDDINEDLYFGVEVNNEKGFITRENYDSGRYKVMALSALTNGNTFYFTNNETLKSLIKYILTINATKVMVFNSSKELFVWLNKN